nr:helix-turn-helix transcriptional regulator [Oceanimonas sp. MB9]
MRVGQVACRLGISSRTLERRLQQQIGLSPAFYQLCVRMQAARLQLARPKASLAQVALSCGYYDQAHFTHAFRRFVGGTPAEYRKRKLSQNYKAP